MGSPLGPLMANVFMCSIEEKLESEGKMPTFYRRYVDDTLATVPDLGSAEALLTTLNEAHPLRWKQQLTTSYPSLEWKLKLQEIG